jgi:two-component system, chemotaxis family, protein-glutamate methylesterase/glutaminase
MAAGLWTIKRLGGIAVIQCPADALSDAMRLRLWKVMRSLE